MKRKKLSVLLLAAALLTGCGGRPEPAPVPPEASASAAGEPDRSVLPELPTPEPEAPMSEPEDPSGEDGALLRAALDFYEARTGYRPGAARVDSRSEEGVSIQLYDDMGTHTATCAWYLVDPDTLTGTDEITGEAIDLSPHAYG